MNIARSIKVLECLVLGDSIAVGVSKYTPQCEIHAKGGINSWQMARQVNAWPMDKAVRHTIISIGTNDYAKLNTKEYVNQIRFRIRGPVTWILPSQEIKPQQRELVEIVAKFWGDTVITVKPAQLAKDRIHLTGTGYKEIAEEFLNERK
jgi:hypothetical protein